VGSGSSSSPVPERVLQALGLPPANAGEEVGRGRRRFRPLRRDAQAAARRRADQAQNGAAAVQHDLSVAHLGPKRLGDGPWFGPRGVVGLGGHVRGQATGLP
jgi:hypothetical protein